MDLYIVRHGESGRSLADLKRDNGRSLTSEGRKEVEEIADSIGSLGVEFDDIASSPLPRAKETAQIIARRQKKAKFLVWDELRPEGDRRAMLSRLAKMGHESEVLLVGHEPYLTSVVADLMGARSGTILLKKAGLVRVRVTSFAPSVKGELRWLLSPRVLKSVS
ncbi:MAG: phosphohistidine phosphatase SixA [Nitrososphaerales archaeon]